MNQTKRWIGLVLALAMVFALAVPAAYAESSTTVFIHKVVMDKDAFGTHDTERYYDATKEMTQEQLVSFFGEGSEVKVISGVKFDVYELNSSYNNPDLLPDKNAIYKGSFVSGEGKPLDNGKKYLIVENQNESTYQGEHGELLTAMKAVPQIITLPYISENGIAAELHLYPKNTEDKPTLTKTITDSFDQGINPNYDIGGEVSYEVETTVPAHAKYATFVWKDTMPDGLTLGEGLTISTNSSTVTLVENTDYTLTKSDSGFELVLLGAGLDQINNRDSELTITFNYKATLNQNAHIDAANTNTMKLSYHNSTAEGVAPLELKASVDAYTGGHRFVKVEQGDTKRLAGAEFVVKKGENQFLAQQQELWTWVTDEEGATRFTSDTDGNFEVRGLAYGAYQLVEVKAPTGYARLQEPITFTIDGTSYSNTESEPTKVNNIKITIPQTGGMGTVAFGVVGVVLMGGALLGMKRKKDEDEQ